MQKSSFFKIVITLFTATIMPVIAMEITPIKPRFVAIIYATKMTQEDVKKSLNTISEQSNKHACEALGIPWEENNNLYRVDVISLRNIKDEKAWSWLLSHPDTLPLTKKPNTNKILSRTVTFPTMLPATFAERLEKEQFITLSDILSETPVEIIVTGKLETNPQQPETSLEDVVQCLNNFIKKMQEKNNTLPNTPEEQSTTAVTTDTTDNINNTSTEKSSLTTTEIPKFIVTLNLREVTQEDIKRTCNKRYDERDKHACAALGIKWEDNNNTYLTNYASFKRPNDTEYLCCWKNKHPKCLPLFTKPDKDGEYKVTFPTSLPASFVEELEQKGSITLTNTRFTQPVEIIIELGPIAKLEKTTLSNTATTLTQPTIETQKSTTTTQPTATPSQSNVPKYLFFGGCAISAITFIALLLHYTNKLDLSQITNFLTTNK